MNECNNRVIYDQWPYMTIIDALEVMVTVLRKVIQIDRLLFEERREQ
jgi:hypothetical protein